MVGNTRFRSKKRASLSAEIADRICDEIREKKLGPGASLGTEADLAGQHGVSRTVIREAVSHLRELGVVNSRQGLGLTVGNCDITGCLEKMLAPIVAGSEEWHELTQLRFMFEVGALPLAAQHATPAQLERMRQLALEMVQLVDQLSDSPEALDAAVSEKEIEFHQMLFDATGSRFARRFHELLMRYFWETRPLGRHGPHIPDLPTMQDHVDLVDAIAAKNVDRALTILIKHLSRTVSFPDNGPFEKNRGDDT